MQVTAKGWMREVARPQGRVRLEAVTDTRALWFEEDTQELVLVNIENGTSAPVRTLCGAPEDVAMTKGWVYWKTHCGSRAWKRMNLSVLEVVEELPEAVSRQVAKLCVDGGGAVGVMGDGYVRWDDGTSPKVVSGEKPKGRSCTFARRGRAISWEVPRTDGKGVVIEERGETRRIATASTPSGVKRISKREVTWIEKGRT